MILFLKFLVVIFSICFKDNNAEFINMKIVDEPSSYGLNNAVGGYYGHNLDTLKMKVKPANFSGPAHFERLKGKCFSNVLESYKYELCPFSNVTQYEQSLRWNPYSGVLGVWQEWEIENNTFVAMVMKNGDSCNDKTRQVKVYFKCGRKTDILNVTEPSTCAYHLLFQTPLVCPEDAMLVYPVLSREHQLEWDDIETRYFNQELTEKGYRKKLQKLFESAGLYLSDDKKHLLELVEDVKKPDIAAVDNNSRFKTQTKCEKEYEKLEKENERLKKILLDNGINSDGLEESTVKSTLNTTQSQAKNYLKNQQNNSEQLENTARLEFNMKNQEPFRKMKNQQINHEVKNQLNHDVVKNQGNMNNLGFNQNSHQKNQLNSLDFKSQQYMYITEKIKIKKKINNLEYQENVVKNQQKLLKNQENVKNQQKLLKNQENIFNNNYNFKNPQYKKNKDKK